HPLIVTTSQANQSLVAGLSIIVAQTGQQGRSNGGSVRIDLRSQSKGGPIAYISVSVAGEFDQDLDRQLILVTQEAMNDPVAHPFIWVVLEGGQWDNRSWVLTMTQRDGNGRQDVGVLLVDEHGE